MLIAQTIYSWGTAHLPVVIGIGVAIAVLVALFLLSRRRGSLHPVAAPLTVPKAEQSAQWSPPEQSFADRRGALRRDGKPVKVQLASPVFRNGVSEGFVTDRSTGGLRITMREAIAPGNSVQVRAMNAPNNVGFIMLIVRSCHKQDDYFEMGCEFEHTPPWSVLLLFG